MEKGIISVRQFTILVFMYSLGTSVIAIPSLATSFAQENAWITIIIASLIGLLIVFLLIKIHNLAPNKNLFELIELVFGKWIGKAITCLFIIFIYFITAGNLRQIGDFITTQIMVDTPIQIIFLIFVLVSLIGVKMGLEVIGRSCEVFFPYAIISLILLIILVAPQAEFTNIQPILEKNLDGVFLTVLPVLGSPYFELFVFLAIIPYVSKVKLAKKNFFIGVAVASLILIAITFMCILVLGAEFTARNLYPTYILGKKISVAEFLERIEILVAIAWFFTIFFKITINFYVLSLALSHLFQLKTPKTLSTPIAFILVIQGVYMGPNVIHYLYFIAYVWPFFSGTFGLVLPFIILVVGLIKKRDKLNVTK